MLNNDVSVMIINCDLYGWLYHAMNSEINHVHDMYEDIFYILILPYINCFKNNKILYTDKMTCLEVKVAFFSFHCAYWYFWNSVYLHFSRNCFDTIYETEHDKQNTNNFFQIFFFHHSVGDHCHYENWHAIRRKKCMPWKFY